MTRLREIERQGHSHVATSQDRRRVLLFAPRRRPDPVAAALRAGAWRSAERALGRSPSGRGAALGGEDRASPSPSRGACAASIRRRSSSRSPTSRSMAARLEELDVVGEGELELGAGEDAQDQQVVGRVGAVVHRHLEPRAAEEVGVDRGSSRTPPRCESGVSGGTAVQRWISAAEEVVVLARFHLLRLQLAQPRPRAGCRRRRRTRAGSTLMSIPTRCSIRGSPRRARRRRCRTARRPGRWSRLAGAPTRRRSRCAA